MRFTFKYYRFGELDTIKALRETYYNCRVIFHDRSSVGRILILHEIASVSFLVGQGYSAVIDQNNIFKIWEQSGSKPFQWGIVGGRVMPYEFLEVWYKLLDKKILIELDAHETTSIEFGII